MENDFLRSDRIKALLWESDGFVLIYKRLAVKGRFRWARNSSEARNLTWQEFDWLMSGLDIEQPKAIRAQLRDVSKGLKPLKILAFSEKNILNASFPKGVHLPYVEYIHIRKFKEKEVESHGTQLSKFNASARASGYH